MAKNLGYIFFGAFIGLVVYMIVWALGFYNCFFWNGKLGVCSVLYILSKLFVLYILVGALIGWIVGKIKNKNGVKKK